MTAQSAAAGIHVHAETGPRQAEILEPAALAFLADLHHRFDGRRRELLARRSARQKLFDAGQLPHFLTETKSVRDGDWTVGPIPPRVLGACFSCPMIRRQEISTSTVADKMIGPVRLRWREGSILVFEKPVMSVSTGDLQLVTRHSPLVTATTSSIRRRI